MNKTDSSDNKIKINHFDSNQSIVWDDHSNNNDDNSQTQSNDKDNSEDKSHGELDSPQQLKDLKSNKIVDQENQILIYVESGNSTSVSTNNHTGLTSTSTLIQGLFLQYLHKVVITILCLRPLYKNISTIMYILSLLLVFLPVSLQKDILHHLYAGISTIVHLLLSVVSIYTSLRSEFLQSPLLVSLRSRILQLSLLTSLWLKFLLVSPLVFLWKIFLRRLKYPYGHAYAIKNWNICTGYTFKTWNTFTKYSGIYDQLHLNK